MRAICLAAFAGVLALAAGSSRAGPVAVRQLQGVLHGFLTMKTESGDVMATGETTQFARDGRMTNHLIFSFKDGSVQEETTIFSQHDHFRLISYHLIQKGKTFPHPLDMAVDATNGGISAHYADDKGAVRQIHEQIDAPDDLSNGIVPLLIANLAKGAPAMRVAFIAPTPKPRLVHLRLTAAGTDPFTVGGRHGTAIHYLVKVELGGLAGVIAPILGKQPPDTSVWIVAGEAPFFIKSEGPLYADGPIVRIELAGTPAFN